jgi:hypothetical protein
MKNDYMDALISIVLKNNEININREIFIYIEDQYKILLSSNNLLILKDLKVLINKLD